MRLNLRLRGTAEKLILDMCEANGVEPKDIILDALALYSVAVKHAKEGRAIAADIGEGKYREFTTPTLETLSSSVATQEYAKQSQAASAG